MAKVATVETRADRPHLIDVEAANIMPLLTELQIGHLILFKKRCKTTTFLEQNNGFLFFFSKNTPYPAKTTPETLLKNVYFFRHHFFTVLNSDEIHSRIQPRHVNLLDCIGDVS